MSVRTCLRNSIPEIFEAAKLLDDAATAHLENRRDVADQLIRQANMPAIRDWVESIWGKNPGFLPKGGGQGTEKHIRVKERMPTPAQKTELL